MDTGALDTKLLYILLLPVGILGVSYNLLLPLITVGSSNGKQVLALCGICACVNMCVHECVYKYMQAKAKGHVVILLPKI